MKSEWNGEAGVNDPIIVVKDLVKRYGTFTAVDHVSFEVERGSIFGFLGPNGAGKSSTIHALCTISGFTSGALSIDGIDVGRDQNGARSRIGVVFQECTLDPKMTVEENLYMHGCFYGMPKHLIRERTRFVLELVDMSDWRKAMAGGLSGGMKRRVEIARSLLHMPQVLFLDEPTTGLDPRTRAGMWAYIDKLRRERGITVFLTTHYMDEAEICNRVAIIDKGKIVAIDSPASLKKRYVTDKARIASRNPDALEKLLERHGMNYTPAGEDYLIQVADASSLMELISEHRTSIQRMEVSRGTLNDVYLEITGKDIRG
ncbi:ATP-binding cassette domain-containing protein [Paenibacillus sp. 1011MAR3C5]|uniref:ABC transporter ATP-binding protein n=1 Tax=Paenibacillus sp. 1011MAR3C5 TaxID=1675787 RepID=UPI000E6CBE27|nr:ATP-binding cassette domain-containing protein [Paenibacillus sp. 1011MAR3C5]RJE89688.1 ATP-binding cassette domain-containing protein [Paenibacillus sp. 1011MAR3C5]